MNIKPSKRRVESQQLNYQTQEQQQPPSYSNNNVIGMNIGIKKKSPRNSQQTPTHMQNYSYDGQQNIYTPQQQQFQTPNIDTPIDNGNFHQYSNNPVWICAKCDYENSVSYDICKICRDGRKPSNDNHQYKQELITDNGYQQTNQIHRQQYPNNPNQNLPLYDDSEKGHQDNVVTMNIQVRSQEKIPSNPLCDDFPEYQQEHNQQLYELSPTTNQQQQLNYKNFLEQEEQKKREYQQLIEIQQQIEAQGDLNEHLQKLNTEQNEQNESLQNKLTEAQEQIEEAENSKICSICLTNEKNCVLQCGHRFCLECANSLNQKTSKCPMCRKKIVNIIKTFD